VTRRTVLLFGDSNTHGTTPMAHIGDIGRHPEEQRWPGVLARALGAGWRVIDEGHPGRTTLHDDPIEGAHKNGLRALPALLESHRPLDLVVIMLGTNDLKRRFSVTASDIAASAEKLILAVRQSEAGPNLGAPPVLLVAPPPIAETGCLAGMFEGGAAKSLTLGARMAEAAERQGVAFLDLAGRVEVDPLDGIHYGIAAHAAIGAAVAEAIARAWP
jgi:lysophospholipase L1-like esterase